MNLVAMNDKDEIYEDPESTEDDESEDSDDMAASVEAAVKQEEEIVITEAAAVNDGDGDDVNTFVAAIVVEDEAVNAKCVGVEAVKGDIMVKGSKANATAKGQVLKEDERVEGYETREVLGGKMPRRSERHKKISQGLDVKALNFKTRKQRFKVQELQGSCQDQTRDSKLVLLVGRASNRVERTARCGGISTLRLVLGKKGAAPSAQMKPTASKQTA
ncbi:unnamed protein product [Closterium sp. Naga37s-1]|nr:unnamed protein product [Closterium sp. Naga37s-1]